MKAFLLITFLFFSFPLLAKVCEIKKFKECINNNSEIECDKNIYWNIVKDKLWYYGSLDDPPIAKIKLRENIVPSLQYNVCGNRKCQGKVIFSTFDKYKENYYPKNEWAWYRYEKKNSRFLIYDHMTNASDSPRKFLYIIKDNNFELHESFKLEPPNIAINRTSFGVCYD